MTDPTSLTLAQARDALRARELSALELTETHLSAVEGARALNAFVRKRPIARATWRGLRMLGWRKAMVVRSKACRSVSKTLLHGRCAHDGVLTDLG